MKNAVILHGTFNNPNDNWFPWLKKQLEKKSYKVWVPNLPGADKPNIDRYNKFLFKNWQFDKDSVLIGHSSGAVAILGILQALPNDAIVGKAIVVAGFKDDLDWDPTRELFAKPFDYQKIKTKAKKFILIHSDDDPYVSIEHGYFLKEKLGGELIIMKGQKHFNIADAGRKYLKFPEILEYI